MCRCECDCEIDSPRDPRQQYGACLQEVAQQQSQKNKRKRGGSTATGTGSVADSARGLCAGSSGCGGIG